ncbi:MAG TPA: methyltransferase, partial [Candidatus Merdenecus merdavium]|nr:methyltransferase [Candidatus Merdenecus merdavium]
QRLHFLNEIETTRETEKHVREEMRELSTLIVRMEGVSRHRFFGWDQTYELVLLTNRNFAKVTRDELIYLEPNAKTKILGVGVKTKVTNLRWLEKIRTYQEALFMIGGIKTCAMDPEQIAEMVHQSELLPMLSKSHEGEPPFYFRVEMKSKRSLDEKSIFVKKLSSLIEKKTKRKLINTTDKYEMELRIIENKEGNVNLLVKLFTIQDQRFSYRKEVIPTSIRPVNAALTIALAKDYLRENAQVLDPFCGVGTMLIERHMAVKANTMYGLDIQEEAILKARKNTESAGQIAHYINRDFFSFQHDYLFDEVITNMPFQIGRISKEMIYEIYQSFFEKVGNHLKEGAMLILYSHNKDYMKQMAPKYGFQTLQEYEISKKEETYVFVLEYQ